MNKLFDIFFSFIKLGLISFGGPAAHIGYFQKTFVEKHQWLDNKEYASVVALSQFLPGPGSSQVGFTLGYRRAGLLGGIAAFIGFTLPSFILMVLIGIVGSQYTESDSFVGAVNGLKLLAVVVVADAVLSMSRSFCQHHITRSIAVITAIFLIVIPSIYTQIICLIIAGSLVMYYRNTLSIEKLNESSVGRKEAKGSGVVWSAFIVFLILLLPIYFWFFESSPLVQIFSQFYQSGSFVFGGGHVVLPLLQQTVGDNLSADQFLTGYAVAQAVPGPMFSLAAYLGTQLLPHSPIMAASIACLAIFLPGFLLIIAFEKSWQIVSTNTKVTNAMMGVNAAVVGLLIAALYQPTMLSAIHGWIDFLFVVVGFVLLKYLRLPIVALVMLFITVGILRVLL